ncbi:MAG: hypothetical protein JWQ71_4628 [Pedosphaera sp.]|nr:hypothetical protein [Pedosphaera sp.]
MPESDARLAEIIRGHLDIHPVTNADADEVFAHFAGDIGQHFMAIRQRYFKHGARQYLGYGTGNLYWFFFSQAMLICLCH